jgi:cytohesin
MNRPVNFSPPPQTLDEVRELGRACERGDVDRVAALLSKHPDVRDSPDFDERFHYPESQLWSPLGKAAMNGQAAVVDLLLDMGVNPVPYEVAAQYHAATYHDWTDEVRERGHHGIAARIDAAIATRYGPLVDEANLHQAVRDRDVKRVEALLDESPGRISQVDRVGNTALHWAVAVDRPKIVRLLVDRGALVHARNGDGRTPAVVALFGFHRYWREEEKPGVLRLLLERGAEYTTLIASSVGDIDRVRVLLAEDPARANAADPGHRRPLSCAAVKGRTEIVRLLLAYGANPNAKEAVCQGGYSLHQAAWHGHTEIVRLLLDAGATPSHWVDSSGDSLFAATHRGQKRILQMKVYAAGYRIDVVAEVLKQNPSLANQVLPYGWDEGGSEEIATDIMRLAIRHGARFEHASEWDLRWTVEKYPRLFRLLMEHGADPHVQVLGISGDERRRWRDRNHHLQTIRFLVEECGGDVNGRNAEGFTPLALAARQGHSHLVEYFLSRGATPNGSAPTWAQPLHLAEKHGHRDIADLLRRHGIR